MDTLQALPPHPSAPPAPPTVPATGDALPPAVAARLAHLFRGSRQRGLIHPLEHVLLQYRSAQPQAAGEASA